MENYTENQAQEKSNSKRKELVTTLTKGPLSWLELGAYALLLSGLFATLNFASESHRKRLREENAPQNTGFNILEAYSRIQELSRKSSFPIGESKEFYLKDIQKINQKSQLDSDFYKLIN